MTALHLRETATAEDIEEVKREAAEAFRLDTRLVFLKGGRREARDLMPGHHVLAEYRDTEHRHPETGRKKPITVRTIARIEEMAEVPLPDGTTAYRVSLRHVADRDGSQLGRLLYSDDLGAFEPAQERTRRCWMPADRLNVVVRIGFAE